MGKATAALRDTRCIASPTEKDLANAMAHLIVANGIVPGCSASCRCDECRLVAIAMDEAGYLDRIHDRWWE